jgi:two-component system phosphate regulon response regulator PhoB
MSARILVLDEDSTMRSLYHAILEDEGYEVIALASLPDVEIIRDLQPDLILLDYFRSPTPRGWIFLIQLKTYSDTEQIPVVICTAHTAMVAAHAHDLATFNVNVVPKPFSVEDFIAAIRYTRHSQQQRRHA